MLAVLQAATTQHAHAPALPTNFAAYYDAPSGAMEIVDITSDNAGNMYACGKLSPTLCGVFKFDSGGTILWSKTYSVGSRFQAVCIDSVSAPTRVYCCSAQGDLVSYNSSTGALIWKKKYGGAGNNVIWNDVIFDSVNMLVHCCGRVASSTVDPKALISAYNTSGLFQFSATMTQSGTAVNCTGYALGWNASNPGKIFMGGTYHLDTLFIKGFTIPGGYGDSTPHRFYKNVVDSMGDGIYADSSGGYVFSAWSGDGSSGLTLVGVNSAAAIQWKRCITSPMSSAAMHCDGTYVYVGGGRVAGSALMAKYNLSGAVQWKRTMANGTLTCTGMTVDGTNFLAAGDLVSSNSGATWSLPADGSLTGTNAPWTYAASSLTEGASGLTDGDTTTGDGAGRTLTYADSTASYGDALGSGLDATVTPTLMKTAFA